MSRLAPSSALVLALLCAVWMSVSTQRLSVAAFIGASAIMADFGITAAVAGLLVGAYLPAYGAMQLPAGLLVDRVRPRLILIWALVCLAASSLLFALAPSVGWAILARVAVGLSSGPIWLACLRICADLSLRHYPRWVGLLVTAGSVGTIVGLAGLPLLLAVLPWRTVALLLIVPIVVVLPLIVLAPLPRPAIRERVDPLKLLGQLGPWLRSASFWWLTLPAVTWCGAYFGLLSWLPRFARDVLGTDPAFTGVLPGLFSGGLLVGGVLAGSIHNRWRAFGPRLYFGGGALFATCIVLLPVLERAGANALLYLLALCLGLLFGCFFIWMGLLSELAPTAQLGALTGLINGLTFVPAFTNPWLVGLILDLVDRPVEANPTYSATAYATAFLLLAATMAVGLLGGLLCGRLRTARLRSAALGPASSRSG